MAAIPWNLCASIPARPWPSPWVAWKPPIRNRARPYTLTLLLVFLPVTATSCPAALFCPAIFGSACSSISSLKVHDLMRCKLSWLSNCFLILMHHWIHLHVPSILWQIIVNFTVHEDYITFGDRDAWGLLSLLSGLTRLKIASTNQRKFQMFPSQTNPCLISLEFGLRRAWIVEQFFNQWLLLTQKHMKAKNDLERGRERKRERERGKGKRMEERKREWERKKGKKNERTREGERDSTLAVSLDVRFT